jgi:hypothetical protein
MLPLMSAVLTAPLTAQPKARIAATAVLIGTTVDPTPDRGSETEVRLVQPTVRLTGWWGALFGVATVNLEGVTIGQAELSAGAWGEGFVDRRHPHTYAHELLVGATTTRRCLGATRCGAGAFIGKGFVAFGSDDPMTRPTARFPINHHWAQILERAVITGQVVLGPALVEGSLFNGDEPERPGQWPRLARFGDSWAARATFTASKTVAASASLAAVASPEHRPGAGSTQHKVHLGLRFESTDQRWYGLAEWARTSELDGFWVFRSALVEGQWRPGRGRFYYRFERSDRPEEERLSLYRAVRPHLENSILGISRWTLHTIGGGFTSSWPRGGGSVDPFLEVTIGRVRDAGPGLFRVAEQYGTRNIRSLSAGVRVSWRMAGHRMGRYGLASDDGPDSHLGRPH